MIPLPRNPGGNLGLIARELNFAISFPSNVGVHENIAKIFGAFLENPSLRYEWTFASQVIVVEK